MSVLVGYHSLHKVVGSVLGKTVARGGWGVGGGESAGNAEPEKAKSRRWKLYLLAVNCMVKTSSSIVRVSSLGGVIW